MVKRGQAILYSPTFSSTYTAETNGDEPPLNKDDKRRKGKSKGHYKTQISFARQYIYLSSNN